MNSCHSISLLAAEIRQASSRRTARMYCQLVIIRRIGRFSVVATTAAASESAAAAATTTTTTTTGIYYNNRIALLQALVGGQRPALVALAAHASGQKKFAPIPPPTGGSSSWQSSSFGTIYHHHQIAPRSRADTKRRQGNTALQAGVQSSANMTNSCPACSPLVGTKASSKASLKQTTTIANTGCCDQDNERNKGAPDLAPLFSGGHVHTEQNGLNTGSMTKTPAVTKETPKTKGTITATTATTGQGGKKRTADWRALEGKGGKEEEEEGEEEQEQDETIGENTGKENTSNLRTCFNQHARGATGGLSNLFSQATTITTTPIRAFCTSNKIDSIHGQNKQQQRQQQEKYWSSKQRKSDLLNNTRPVQSENFNNNRLNFGNMADIQRLAHEPSREHIENIRQLLRQVNAKDNNDQLISLDKDSASGIGIICIRSAAKNGVSAKMMCDFLDVIDQLYAWPEGKGVLIHGHGGFFCSGGDLVSVRELANYEDGLKMATLMQYNLARLQALPMISMALVQGKAIGGGAEIAVTTDLRVMANSALIGYVHCRVGIMAAWGGGSRLVQLLGPSRALELMSSGRLVQAKEALQLGLANQLIDDSSLNNDQVLELAKRYLCEHTQAAQSSLMAIKSLVNAARTLPLERALVVEAQLLSSTWGKPAHLEALNNNVKHRGD